MARKESFQAALRAELRKSGIVSSITADLRKQMYDVLSEHHHCRGGKCNLEQVAIRSFVLEYLISDDLQQTASMLAAESSFLDNNRFLSRKDALKVYGIISDSTIHQFLIDSLHKGKIEDEETNSYEDTTIHALLFQAALSSRDFSKISVASQTDSRWDNYLESREQLDQQLEIIEKKYYAPTTCNKRDFEVSIETKLASIQKECDQRAKIETEERIKQFQTEYKAVIQKKESVRHEKELLLQRLEIKKAHDEKINQMLLEQNDMKRSHELKEREQELNLMKVNEKLKNEVNRVRIREESLISKLEVEKNKVRIEEQRIQQISMDAERKLEFTKKREKAMEEAMEEGMDKILIATKQLFGDVSNIAANQQHLISNSLQEIATFQLEIPAYIDKIKVTETQLGRLHQEKDLLSTELEHSRDEVVKLKHVIAEKSYSHNESSTQQEMRIENIESNLLDTQRKLQKQKKANEFNEYSFAEYKLQMESRFNTTQNELKRAIMKLGNMSTEKSILEQELKDSKTLFARSQEALHYRALTGKYQNGHELNHKTDQSLQTIDPELSSKPEESIPVAVFTTRMGQFHPIPFTKEIKSKYVKDDQSIYASLGETSGKKQLLTPCSNNIEHISNGSSPDTNRTLQFKESKSPTAKQDQILQRDLSNADFHSDFAKKDSTMILSQIININQSANEESTDRHREENVSIGSLIDVSDAKSANESTENAKCQKQEKIEEEDSGSVILEEVRSSSLSKEDISKSSVQQGTTAPEDDKPNNIEEMTNITSTKYEQSEEDASSYRSSSQFESSSSTGIEVHEYTHFDNKQNDWW